MTPLALAGAAAAAVVVLGVSVCILRRSLLAVAFGAGLATLGLALGAGLVGDEQAAGLILVGGLVAAVTLSASAVAVYRRRGADFIDELRELGGG